MESNKINLSDILNKYNKIIIPEIQRDYVMGSGGKKLESLFSSMNNSLQNEFSFSCIVGYEDRDNNSLYVYDGQQRLVTLIFLCSYLNKLNKDEAKKSLFNKFEFIGREKANEWIANPCKIDGSEVVDFTTYSLLELKNSFEKKWLKDTNGNCILAFLQEKVYFDMVLVDKISDAEQFFLDINDGLDLKPYEIYKAALYHHASIILDKNFKKFAMKMENEWLNYFSKYKKDERKNSKNKILIPKVCEEEALIYFLKYCFRMMWIENNGNDEKYIEDDVTWLTYEHFERIENITDAIVTKFSDVIGVESTEQIINYSIDNTGAHWNITYKNYSEMLNKFFNNIWNIEETKKDIIVWCYISRLPNESYMINDHLRMIKKILNHNRFECQRADISFEDWGFKAKKIYYARYYVRGIPKYYLNNKNYFKNPTKIYYFNDNPSDYEGFFNKIIKNNKYNDLTKWEIEDKKSLLGRIIANEILKKNSNNYDKIKEIENISFINGIVDNFIEYDYENKTCVLKNNDIIEQLNVLEASSNYYQYKNILKFICDNKLKIDNFSFNDVLISWTAYTGTKYCQKGTLISHTWCDLFTINKEASMDSDDSTDKETANQNSVFGETEEDFRHRYFYSIPDGWFEDSYIVQPDDNIYTNDNYPKPAFAANKEMSNIFSVNDFLK